MSAAESIFTFHERGVNRMAAVIAEEKYVSHLSHEWRGLALGKLH